MFENNLIAGVSGQGGGYSINDSLRFNDDDSAYLSRTPATASNRKTFTWSGWVKRGNLSGVRQTIFGTNNVAGTLYWAIEFETNDTINVYDSNSSGSSAVFSTTAVFRDVSGWYHIVVAIDTTQATSTNRAKLYINGIEITSFTDVNYPPLNSDTRINSAEQHSIASSQPAAGFYLDGYLAEINCIDGQALTPDDFGEINATTGEWSPIAYEGTYGTNGFYLPFDGNANDDSGNGNNWTENNLASTDYMIDTPTNNFSVLNPLDNGGSTISNGNLEHTSTNTSWKSTRGTIAVNSGKWYWEGVFTAGGTANADAIGFALGSASLTSFAGDTHSYGYIQSGVTLADGGGSVAYGDSYTTNDIIGIALDLDAGTCTFYKNNVSQGQAFSGLSGTFFPFSDTYDNSKWNLNFGADSSFAGNKTRQGNTDANGIGDFYYAPPAGGYLALCTENLPEPAIVQPETQFNVVTWTGDSTTNRAITGVGFQPDFVWIKRRNGADGHIINDSVRGIPNNIFPFSTLAENTTAYLSSFDSDGFTLDIVAQATNLSGGTYVAWCWKAGGTAVSNTDGSITSQVSANVDAGFSIVSYTGTGAASATVGHGLGQTPAMIIQKAATDGVYNWNSWHKNLDTNSYISLNTTAAQDNSVNVWPTAGITSSVFTTASSAVKYNNLSGVTHIAYCFAEVEGFSKFGSYVGNGSDNGPFVYTAGFKPAFVLAKRTDSTGNWVLKDTARDTYNPAGFTLLADVADAEYGPSNTSLDILSNGFKPRTTSALVNASGGTYIYMAFAENPFKYATGR
jgi:hypothetical protein